MDEATVALSAQLETTLVMALRAEALIEEAAAAVVVVEAMAEAVAMVAVINNHSMGLILQFPSGVLQLMSGRSLAKNRTL